MNTRAQSIIELISVIMLVTLSIYLIGPTVIRGFNAHFKLWDESIQDSYSDSLVKSAKDPNYPAHCICDGWVGSVGKRCGAGPCADTERYENRLCNPVGCGEAMGEVVERCTTDPLCCTDKTDTPNCGLGTTNPGDCPLGSRVTTKGCGATAILGCRPDDKGVADDGNPSCVPHCLGLYAQEDTNPDKTIPIICPGPPKDDVLPLNPTPPAYQLDITGVGKPLVMRGTLKDKCAHPTPDTDPDNKCEVYCSHGFIPEGNGCILPMCNYGPTCDWGTHTPYHDWGNPHDGTDSGLYLNCCDNKITHIWLDTNSSKDAGDMPTCPTSSSPTVACNWTGNHTFLGAETANSKGKLNVTCTGNIVTSLSATPYNYSGVPSYYWTDAGDGNDLWFRINTSTPLGFDGVGLHPSTSIGGPDLPPPEIFVPEPCRARWVDVADNICPAPAYDSDSCKKACDDVGLVPHLDAAGNDCSSTGCPASGGCLRNFSTPPCRWYCNSLGVTAGNELKKCYCGYARGGEVNYQTDNTHTTYYSIYGKCMNTHFENGAVTLEHACAVLQADAVTCCGGVANLMNFNCGSGEGIIGTYSCK